MEYEKPCETECDSVYATPYVMAYETVKVYDLEYD